MIDTQKLLHPSPTTIEDARKRVETEKEYHNHHAVSQSDLKYLEHSPRKFQKEKLQYEPDEYPYVDMGKHPKMGTMVEQHLLEPERFKENFIEQERMETPSSPNQKEFVQLILSGEFGMVEAHNKAYANSNPSKAAKLYEELEDYIEFQNESAGKGVYDQDEKETLLHVCGDIFSHRKASNLLTNDQNWKNTWNQLALFGEVNNVFCKGLLDRVIHVKDDKFIIVDLKVTSKPLYNFSYWFCRRKYYLQFAMYCKLFIRHARAEWNKGVRVQPVMVASRKEDPYDTMTRTVPTSLIKNGAEEIHILTNRLKWHIEADEWDRRRDYYENDDYPKLHYDKSNVPGLQL